MSKALNQFHPEIKSWFEAQFQTPTPVQEAAWPVIASGEHALITAPTGSGKTLTAFLWSLNRFATGEWQPGATRLLYVSPLKALNNDIQRNLLTPLRELQQVVPPITVSTRSGDTSQNDRQRMLRNPPDILITTPESLMLLLTNTRGRLALGTVESIIIDEVHSMVDNRRGATLMTSAERLLDLTGSLQRIALSATVEPLQAVADYVGGFDSNAQPRNVAIVNPPASKEIAFNIEYPPEVDIAAKSGDSVWDPIAQSFRAVALKNRSTLFFTNSRAMAEKITLKINDHSDGLLAYSHHGSLALDIRSEVERRLKAGELRAIVATSSLEMGIDIGSLDRVVLLQSPPGIAATLQRIGRAGHQVNEVSRGTLFPVHDFDFVEAAALARAVAARDLEPLKPLKGALDSLSQVIVSMCAAEKRQADDVYQLVIRSSPYASLHRHEFDLVLDLLAGRYAGARVRELQPRIIYNRIDGTLESKKSALFALYNSGGNIPDRGYYQIRHSDSGAKIGELDEEYVWEARVGDTFTIGTQHWQINQINHNDVLVSVAKSGVAPPFWRAERHNRSVHYAARIAEFLQQANTLLDSNADAELKEHLVDQLVFDNSAADKLIDYLHRQREKSGTELPHRNHLLLELANTGPGGYKGPDSPKLLVIHTLWGGRLNHPWSLALKSAWQEKYHAAPQIHADNNAIAIQVTDASDPAEVLGLVTPDNLEHHLRNALESSGFFGTRFRECAGRFLLLPRQKFNQRLPLWMSRLQAKKLMSATMDFEDFPVMLEAWRSCINDEFDLPALSTKFNEITDGVCSWSFVHTKSPTPFAKNLTFDHVSPLVYADDTPDQAKVSNLSGDLIKATANIDALRPTIEAAIVQQFIAKRQRTHPDYQPDTSEDWDEWVKERILLPENEWWLEWQGKPEKHSKHLCTITSQSRRWVCHLENADTLLKSGLAEKSMFSTSDLPEFESNDRTDVSIAIDILSFYGPLNQEAIEQLLPCIPHGLFNTEYLLSGQLIAGNSETLFCEAENFEILMRWQRASRRPQFEPLDIKNLPGILASLHGFNKASSEQTVIDTVERLRGYVTQVPVLIKDMFSARLSGFAEHQLDSVYQQQQLTWIGTGKGHCCLCYPEDVSLLKTPADQPFELKEFFKDSNAKYAYSQIAHAYRNEFPYPDTVPEANELWWQGVWAGHLSADSLAPLTKGAQTNYKLSSISGRQHSVRRRAREVGATWPGNWQLTPETTQESDALTEFEESRERVHMLLDRYGVVTRELANRETDTLRFARLFKALRVMELAGEVTQGLFFTGMSGPQFVSPATLTRLQQNEKPPKHFWCNALDCISPCGLGLDWPELPQRRVQNYLSFQEGRLALVIENNGGRLKFYVDATDVDIEQVLAPCVYIANTQGKMTVKEINGEPVKTSPWLPALARVLNKRSDHRTVYFEP